MQFLLTTEYRTLYNYATGSGITACRQLSANDDGACGVHIRTIRPANIEHA
ncbi:hypothetical protein E4U15_001886 [Claviceps sp. LM218 group G6]|nr:hypothetical protein E4U15_001886 [Claviceps sp. LM218 group G6]